MSKKLLNKVISAILVLAICSTAFLGCVVSAEGNTVNAVVSNTVLEKGDTVATATVTISSDVAFVAGIFTVKADTGLTLKSASLATEDQGYIETNNNKVLFQGWKDDDLSDCKNYTSLEVTLTFDVVDVQEGVAYNISVESLDVTDITESAYDPKTVESGYMHIHKYETDGTVDGDVTVYDCVVDGCAAVKTELNTDVKVSDIESKNELTETGAYNITFNSNGDVSLNILNTKAMDENTYVAILDEDGNIDTLESKDGIIVEKGIPYNAVQTSKYDAGIKTIAETINAVFVETDATGKIATVSTPIELSVEKYCKSVITNSENYDSLVVDYCYALLNYAVAAQKEFDYKGTAVDITGYEKDYGSISLTTDNNKETGEETSVVDLMLREVSMTTKPTVRLYFAIDSEKLDTLELTFDYNGTKNVVAAKDLTHCVRTNPSKEKVDLYYYDVTDMPAKAMREIITVTATNDGSAVDYTATYSVEAYAAKINKDVTTCLMAYSDAILAKYPN